MPLNPLNPSRVRLRVAVTATAAVLAAGLIAGCGEDRSNLLPGNTAKEISANLDQVRDLAASGDCFGALTAAQEVTRQVESLGSGVDRRLKRSLREGVTQLVLTVQKSCDAAEGETVEEEPVEPETTTTGPTGTTGDTQAEETETPESGTTGRQEQQERPETGGNQGGGSQGGGNQGTNPGGSQPETPSTTNPGTGGGTGPGTGGVGPPTG